MPDKRQIFVFASNLAGRHGKGSALEAFKNHGAVLGEGVGFHGNSYAIPTKSGNLLPLSLLHIKPYIRDFLQFAYAYPEFEFNVVAIGCGLAGYIPEQIAPMFSGHPSNVNLPPKFHAILKERRHVESLSKT